jgi:hypothetical protein
VAKPNSTIYTGEHLRHDAELSLVRTGERTLRWRFNDGRSSFGFEQAFHHSRFGLGDTIKGRNGQLAAENLERYAQSCMLDIAHQPSTVFLPGSVDMHHRREGFSYVRNSVWMVSDAAQLLSNEQLSAQSRKQFARAVTSTERIQTHIALKKHGLGYGFTRSTTKCKCP